MKRTLNNWTALAAMMLVLFAFTGCSDDETTPTGQTGGPKDQVAFVTTAGDTYFDDYNTIDGLGVNLPAATFFTTYTPADPNYFVVDLRSAAEFEFAHIEGAVNWSVGDVIANFDQLPVDQTILFTCKTGQTASYATSIVNLIGTQTGHNAQNLLFGANGYLPPNLISPTDANYRYPTNGVLAPDFVTTAAPAKPAAAAFPTVMTEAETATAVLLERAAAVIGDWGPNATMNYTTAATADPANTMIINYWSPTDYAKGHLDGAYQYTPKVDILSNGALNTLPLADDKEIGIYCWTGQTSAQLAAYLRMVGYDAKSILYGTNGMAYDKENYPELTHNFTPATDSYVNIEGMIVGTYDDQAK